MSFIGKKGRRTKSISSALKEARVDSKIIEKRLGSKRIEDLTRKFTPVALRYFEEKALNFCTEYNLLELARDSVTAKELLFEKGWLHQAMLEDILDFLTWNDVFGKKGREYHSIILPEVNDEDISKRGTELKAHSSGVATLSDMSPFGMSRDLATRTRAQDQLKQSDKKWREEAEEYKIVFALFDRIITRYVLDSMRTGTQPATLDDRPEQLGLLMDSFFRNPSYTIPRMAVIAAAFKQALPFKILDVNCGTGCCVEELLLFNPHVEIIGVTDNLFHQRVAERNLAVFSDQQRISPHIEWHAVQYTQPLPDQLEDLVGQCDMVLINQLFQFCPHETHQRLIDELLTFLKSDGVIAFFQHLRAEPNIPWPHEWLYQTIQGFSGIPAERTFKELFKSETGKAVREIIPLTAYLAY